MKVIFVHYWFHNDGTTRTVLNNINGVRELEKNIDFVLAAGEFKAEIPRYIEKRNINWDSENLVKELIKITKDCDLIIIENPVVGVKPRATLAFKKFAEKSNKKIIYRMHDYVEDRPDFKKNFKDINEIYPKTNNVRFITVNTFDQQRLLSKGLKKVKFLPNAVMNEEKNNENKELRKLFEEKNIVKKNEKIIAYPVRVFARKNIEEALLLTKILNITNGEKYRLIVTVPYDDLYKKEIESLAKKYDIPCSIGKASRYINFEKGYTIKDFYAISDLVITTSVREGFGYVFLEPWLCEKPLIGRNIKDITKDFKEKGIDLDHLYCNEIFEVNENPSERIKKIKSILSDEKKLKKLTEKLKLNEKIKQAKSHIKENKELIIKNYNTEAIGKQFLECMNSFN